jgi:hypothetical protein
MIRRRRADKAAIAKRPAMRRLHRARRGRAVCPGAVPSRREPGRGARHARAARVFTVSDVAAIAWRSTTARNWLPRSTARRRSTRRPITCQRRGTHHRGAAPPASTAVEHSRAAWPRGALALGTTNTGTRATSIARRRVHDFALIRGRGSPLFHGAGRRVRGHALPRSDGVLSRSP